MAAAGERPSGPDDVTTDQNGDRIREREYRGPQEDIVFSIHEIVNVRVPYGNKQQLLVRGTIIDETQNFYTVRYRDPRPDMNIPGKNFCERLIRKKDEFILSKIDPSHYNQYVVDAHAEPRR